MDISIIIPSIRTHYWQRIYDSLVQSCQKYTWEVVFVGPFVNEQVLNSHENILHFHSYASTPICIQEFIPQCNGKLICQISDDCLAYHNGLDGCIDTYLTHCQKEDAVNARYREGENFQSPEFPWYYWSPKGYPPNIYGWAGINPDWWLCLQTLINKEFFIEIGGLDCRFEFVNHCYHDLSFRIQNMGGKVYQSLTELCVYDHMPGDVGDHKPISDAQIGPDTEKFNLLWENKSNRGKIDYNNWKQYEKMWSRRFNKKYKSYDEMCQDLHYSINCNNETNIS